MVKDHFDSQKGNPLPQHELPHFDSQKGNPLPQHELLLPISSKDYFICTITQTG